MFKNKTHESLSTNDTELTNLNTEQQITHSNDSLSVNEKQTN
jgi:hypothetical protein